MALWWRAILSDSCLELPSQLCSDTHVTMHKFLSKIPQSFVVISPVFGTSALLTPSHPHPTPKLLQNPHSICSLLLNPSIFPTIFPWEHPMTDLAQTHFPAILFACFPFLSPLFPHFTSNPFLICFSLTSFHFIESISLRIFELF